MQNVQTFDEWAATNRVAWHHNKLMPVDQIDALKRDVARRKAAKAKAFNRWHALEQE